MIVHRTIESPVGPLFLAAEDRGLVCLSFEGESSTADSDDPASMHLTAAIAQLEEYFAGRRREFELELLPAGTGFPDLPFAEDFRSRRTPACTPARRAARSRLLDSSADRAKRGRSEPDGV